MIKAQASSGFQLLCDDFVKPDLDSREYRLIKLENELEVLLIHDSATDKSSAAIDVDAGSFNDPTDLQGLAHFCEHLLFLGTAKYPKENEYQKYLSDHAGGSNAYTATESTNYYFHVDCKFLDGALDRFSQFFISPMFSSNCQDREIMAINSENDKNLENDGWRFHQLVKSFYTKNHPYSKFSTGNLDTLKGSNVRDRLIDWYNSHYSSNLMKLCILSNHSLDQLTELAVKYFCAIPNKHLDYKQIKYVQPNLPLIDPVYFEKPHIVKIKPIKQYKNLRLDFNVNTLTTDEAFKHIPGSYLSHLIGHESKGSLLYYFKVHKNWVTELSSSFKSIGSIYDYFSFSIELELTNEGMAHIYDILIAVFQYFQVIKNASELELASFYNELVEISNLHFKFKENNNRISNTVSYCASSMQDKYFMKSSNKSKFLCFNHISNKEFSYKAVQKVLQSFVLDNLMVFYSNHTFDVKDLPSKEKWYGSHYKVEQLESFLNHDLKNDLKHLPINPNLGLPLKNPCIPKDFSLKASYNKNVKPKTRPLLIEKNSDFEVWFKQDDLFKVPKGSIVLFISLPNSRSTIVNSIYSKFFKNLILLKLNDLNYQAALVGLRCYFLTDPKGFELGIDGYNDKLMDMLKYFLEAFFDFFNDKVFNNEEKFTLVRENFVKLLKNTKLSTPYAQSDSHINRLVEEKFETADMKLKYLLDKDGAISDNFLNFEGFQYFIKNQLFKEVYLTTMVHGNFEKSSVNEVKQILVNNFYTKLPNGFITKEQNFHRSCILPVGKTFRYECDVENKNSVVVFYHQIEELIKAYRDLNYHKNHNLLILLDLFKIIVNEPFFDQLRTKEQLGYIVLSSLHKGRSVIGYKFLVQSSTHCSYHLESRVEHFIQTYLRKYILEDMSLPDFDAKIEALKISYKNAISYKNLGQESDRFSYAIYNGYYNFNNIHLKLEQVSHISLNDFRIFFKKYFLNDLTSKRIILHLKGKNEAANLTIGSKDLISKGELITDNEKFKSELHLTGCPNPIIDLSNYMAYEEDEDGNEILDFKL